MFIQNHWSLWSNRIYLKLRKITKCFKEIKNLLCLRTSIFCYFLLLSFLEFEQYNQHTIVCIQITCTHKQQFYIILLYLVNNIPSFACLYFVKKITSFSCFVRFEMYENIRFIKSDNLSSIQNNTYEQIDNENHQLLIKR